MRISPLTYKQLQQKYECIVETDRKRKRVEDKKTKFVRCMMRDMAIERIRRKLPEVEEEELSYHGVDWYENRTRET